MKYFAELQADLKQASKNLNAIRQNQANMLANASKQPPGTPGRKKLIKDIKDSQKQTKKASVKVKNARATMKKIKPEITGMVSDLEQASDLFQKNKGSLKTAKKALGTTGDQIKSMKSTARKWLPNAPNIQQLK